MNAELHLNVGMRYSIVTLVFFTTYVVFQFPSTIVIRYLGPRPHLAGITVAWGAVMIGRFYLGNPTTFQLMIRAGMGFVKTWDALAALRVVLGILEAGFFPGCVYLLRLVDHLECLKSCANELQAHGTLDMTCTNAIASSTCLALWLVHVQVYWHTGSCK